MTETRLPGGEISRRELFGLVSHGAPVPEAAIGATAVAIDGERCTGCGLCAVECQPNALDFQVAPQAFEIVFRPAACDGCGRCAAVCPEKCLGIRAAPEAASTDREPVLFRDSMVHCADCRRAIGPESMIRKVRAKLGNSADMPMLDLCPECRVKAQFATNKVRQWK